MGKYVEVLAEVKCSKCGEILEIVSSYVDDSIVLYVEPCPKGCSREDKNIVE